MRVRREGPEVLQGGPEYTGTFNVFLDGQPLGAVRMETYEPLRRPFVDERRVQLRAVMVLQPEDLDERCSCGRHLRDCLHVAPKRYRMVQ